MNITIEDFTQADFDDYMSNAVDLYAEQNIKSGRWTVEEARAKSKEQLDYILKDGLQTKGHVFWNICLEGKKIGHFWFYRRADDFSIFAYDVLVAKEYQNQGIGTSAFPMIQERLKTLGVRKINLNVFSHNTGARRLYERLGFEMTSYNMHYVLD